MGGVDLAWHRAPSHRFERGTCSDLLVVAQRNIRATSVRFDLGFGWREHFCASASAIYVVPAEADARWHLDAESQCVYLAIPAVDAAEILQGLGVSNPCTCLWMQASRGFEEVLVHELVTRLWEEVTLAGSNALLGSSCRVAVLHALARRASREIGRAKRTDPKLPASTLRRVLGVLHEASATELSIERLADEAGLSLFHFSRLFRNTVGCSPYRYYDSLRYRRAEEMLSTTDLSIGEIGRDLGFAHPSQFTRAFARHAGCSPKAYRSRLGR